MYPSHSAIKPSPGLRPNGIGRRQLREVLREAPEVEESEATEGTGGNTEKRGKRRETETSTWN